MGDYKVMRSDPKSDIMDAVVEDSIFFEEEVRIAQKEIAQIKEQLKRQDLSAEAFTALQETLRHTFERFLLAHEQVEQHARVLKEAMP